MISEFPLLAFTVLTGLAAGAYVGAATFPDERETARPWLFPLIALVLVAAGCFGALGHLGRPALALTVLNNPASALTSEGIAACALGVVAAVDLVFCVSKKRASRGVRIVGAVIGVVLMLVMTRAYATTYGVVAWIAAPTLPLFLVGGLAAGMALWAVLRGKLDGALALVLGMLGVLLACVLAWQAVVFAGLGEDALCLGAGAALALAAGAVAFVTRAGKIAPRTASVVVAVLAVAALCVSRYGFYMASIL
ncbi:DmsC/YnfH family molybdoenzyme membrane anchor subunit [Adlercreutzia sp. ZJ473]|uniref:DmsC/YnfH family molybdoenzyme membrane anchor subunit n=1 Tax=Adlercreutzia sp. ZJ473 TaxID=2722822 RepID=UPI0015561C11|nr:DmsC/YnfH family molybdoenzyme membrane anchor subunit [Adlercreutzia sp. ZJ473]